MADQPQAPPPPNPLAALAPTDYQRMAYWRQQQAAAAQGGGGALDHRARQQKMGRVVAFAQKHKRPLKAIFWTGMALTTVVGIAGGVALMGGAAGAAAGLFFPAMLMGGGAGLLVTNKLIKMACAPIVRRRHARKAGPGVMSPDGFPLQHPEHVWTGVRTQDVPDAATAPWQGRNGTPDLAVGAPPAVDPAAAVRRAGRPPEQRPTLVSPPADGTPAVRRVTAPPTRTEPGPAPRPTLELPRVGGTPPTPGAPGAPRRGVSF